MFGLVNDIADLGQETGHDGADIVIIIHDKDSFRLSALRGVPRFRIQLGRRMATA